MVWCLLKLSKPPFSARLLSLLIQQCVSKLFSLATSCWYSVALRFSQEWGNAGCLPGCVLHSAWTPLTLPPLVSPPSSGENQHSAPCVLCGFGARKSCNLSCSSSSFISCLLFIIRSTVEFICCWIVLSHCSCSCKSDKNPETPVLWEQKKLRLKMPASSAFLTTQDSSFMLKSRDSDGQTTTILQ